jgi:TolB-like protein
MDRLRLPLWAPIAVAETAETVSHPNNSGSLRCIDSAAASDRFAWFKRSPTYALLAGAVVIAIVGLVYFTTSGKSENRDAIQSIAVLPFIDESADPDAQYINDKIAESLINSLSKLPQLRVVPRSVVAGYKGREIDPRKVGQELNVRAVVTGRLRRHGDIISIQADLIDLQNVAQLWGSITTTNWRTSCWSRTTSRAIFSKTCV